MPELDAAARARLPDSAFADVDGRRRRLPIHDEAHVRNALARFGRTTFPDEASRERARGRLLRAAKRHGIVPIGFIASQLRDARVAGAADAQAAGARALPSGFVTFLMTDIEGSTGLLARLGEEYARLLSDVRRLLRQEVRRRSGQEVDARADEYFGVFARPDDALAAAVSVARAVRGRAWPGAAAVRLRMGIHGGTPALSETGYVGLAVHTASRVCDAGHGGQILVSGTTAATLALDPSAGITLQPLGRYQLRGLPSPESLAQVVSEGLEQPFPPLRAQRLDTDQLA